MWRRFIGYGVAGWGIEVMFTSMSDTLRRLRGHTYLWMLPIYGAGGLLLERMHEGMAARRWSRWARALAYTGCIYAVEMGSGLALAGLLGDVPWRYRRGWSIGGYVRIDYAPFWYGCGLLFEPLERELHKLSRPARREWRARGQARAVAHG
ncbi:MAG TPA: hypothetical protein VLW85_18770 [Myxococcales bacterium]|nr:hypothetical protein [Myxococcales bacterium]